MLGVCGWSKIEALMAFNSHARAWYLKVPSATALMMSRTSGIRPRHPSRSGPVGHGNQRQGRAQGSGGHLYETPDPSLAGHRQHQPQAFGSATLPIEAMALHSCNSETVWIRLAWNADQCSAFHQNTVQLDDVVPGTQHSRPVADRPNHLGKIMDWKGNDCTCF